jgi:hypothetical protein
MQSRVVAIRYRPIRRFPETLNACYRLYQKVVLIVLADKLSLSYRTIPAENCHAEDSSFLCSAPTRVFAQSAGSNLDF